MTGLIPLTGPHMPLLQPFPAKPKAGGLAVFAEKSPKLPFQFNALKERFPIDDDVIIDLEEQSHLLEQAVDEPLARSPRGAGPHFVGFMAQFFHQMTEKIEISPQQEIDQFQKITHIYQTMQNHMSAYPRGTQLELVV